MASLQSLLGRLRGWLEFSPWDPPGKPHVQLPSSGYPYLDRLRAISVGEERSIVLSVAIADALHFVAPDLTRAVDTAFGWYWHSLSQIAGRFSPSEWLTLRRTLNHGEDYATAREIQEEYARLYQGDDYQPYVLQFRDVLLPRLLAIPQIEFDGVREICRLLHNLDADDEESLAFLGTRLPALRS